MALIVSGIFDGNLDMHTGNDQTILLLDSSIELFMIKWKGCFKLKEFMAIDIITLLWFFFLKKKDTL